MFWRCCDGMWCDVMWCDVLHYNLLNIQIYTYECSIKCIHLLNRNGGSGGDGTFLHGIWNAYSSHHLAYMGSWPMFDVCCYSVSSREKGKTRSRIRTHTHSEKSYISKNVEIIIQSHFLIRNFSCCTLDLRSALCWISRQQDEIQYGI